MPSSSEGDDVARPVTDCQSGMDKPTSPFYFHVVLDRTSMAEKFGIAYRENLDNMEDRFMQTKSGKAVRTPSC
jgi:hypothetical protein